MNAQVGHTDVASYALGLLEEGDRRAFEEHLARCAGCAAELAEFGGLAGILSELGPLDEDEDEAVSPGPSRPSGPAVPAVPSIPDLMRRRRAAERRRRRGTFLIGVAAAAAALVIGVTVGSSLIGTSSDTDPKRPGSPAPQIALQGEPHRAKDPATGVSGTVALESKAWGTQVGLQLGGVRGPLDCRLVAVGRSGRRDVVTGWKVPVKGWGVPGSPGLLVTHGGTGMSRADLARFEVRTDDGRTLLTVPV